MRQKTAFIPTLRKVSEAEMVSHQFLLRAGFIRQLAAGIYTYLPLAWRVLHKIENIVREELDAIGGQELLMPVVNPAELWKESGRWNNYGAELAKLNDRHDREFLLGPTHEETITDLLRDEVNSYKKLPMTLYQIQTKFRDEKRPRSGVLRGREFIMKDAYSFHADRASLDQTYEDMYQAYFNIFNRCGLDFHAVEADSGAMGGKGTHEFMVLSEAGEDVIVICEDCDYAANTEMAEVLPASCSTEESEVQEMELVDTPGAKTIQQVCQSLQVKPEQTAKSLLFFVDGQPVMVLVRGDHEVNDIKLKNLLNATVCELASEEQIDHYTGTQAGYIGPVGLKNEVTIYADYSLQEQAEIIVGANQPEKHLRHVQIGRDFQAQFADLRNIEVGDPCPRCHGTIRFKRGIEVGHIFKLGTRYSDSMEAYVLDHQGRKIPFIMGCYGIGISRLLASIVEQHHDENGIIWPESVAPFAVHLIAVNPKDESQLRIAESLYEQLQTAGMEVLYDDRAERAGVKFKDADLIGLPMRVIVGAKAKEGLVEIKNRRTGRSEVCSQEEILAKLQ